MLDFVSYKVENDKEFDRMIEDTLKKVSSLQIPFKLIANDFYISQKSIFKLKGPGGYPDFQGKKIKDLRKGPLKQATPKRNPISSKYDSYTPYQYYKEKNYNLPRGYPLIKATGRLERASTTSNSPDSILIIKPKSLVIGTDLEYADFLQDGTRKMPARKPFFIGPEVRINDQTRGRLQRWTKYINDYVESVSKRNLEK